MSKKKPRKRPKRNLEQQRIHRSKVMRKIRLWRKSTKCYWCGCETVLVISNQEKLRKYLPDNAATIDHLNRKLGLGVVLACFRCNQERSKLGL